MTPKAQQESFCFSRVSTANPAVRRAGSTATIVSKGIVEQSVDLRKDMNTFQIRKLTIERPEDGHPPVGRRPDIRICRAEQEQATRSRRRRQVGDPAVVSNKQDALRKDCTKHRKRQAFQNGLALRRVDRLHL